MALSHSSKYITPLAKQLLGEQYWRYHELLTQSLPPKWQENKVFIDQISFKEWKLLVGTDAEAFALRYLSPEICQRLGKHLPHPPQKISVHASPVLARQRQRYHEYFAPPFIPKVKPAREYSLEEAQEKINRFLSGVESIPCKK